ncbi:MAG: DMT family transporter [Paludibacter sp.]|nr:DMT family transporter [Paludibacter sp.]
MEKSKKTGHIALLSANIFFGLNTPISRSLMPEILSPFTLTFFRIAGGAILFWLLSLVVKKEHVPKKDILLLFFASIFALSLNQLPFFVGLSMTSPIDASIVVTMLPIITMILAAIIIKEPITIKKAIGVLIGASGALILVLTSHNVNVGESNLVGNLIVLGAVVSFALYLTLFKGLIMRYSAITLMKWMFLFGTIMIYPFCYQPINTTDFSLLSSDIYLRILYMVVIATFFAYMLIPVGQKVLRPTTFSMYNYVQPIVASMLAVWMGIDQFGIEKGLSGVLVFVGVYIVNTSKSKVQLDAERQEKNK